MNNLFEAKTKVKKNELTSLIASLDTYKITVYSRISCNNMKVFICKWGGLLLNKMDMIENYDKTSYKYDSLNKTYKRIYNKYEKYQERDLYNILKNSIVSTISPFNLKKPDKISSERLSCKITQIASKVLKAQDIRGKSYSEINDVLFTKYPDIKKITPKSILIKWGILFWTNMLLFLGCFIFMNISLRSLAWILLFSQIFIGSIAMNALRKWQMCYLVWLFVSAGGTSINFLEMSINNISEGDKKQLSKNFQAIHTLLHSIVMATNEKENLLAKSKQMKDKIISNNAIITQLNNSNLNENSDNRRMLGDKAKENNTLKKEISSILVQTKEKQVIIDKLNKAIQPIEKRTKEALSELWRINFNKIRVDDSVYTHIVRYFSFNDLERFEKRLYELANAKEPDTVGKKYRNNYSLSFLTIQNDLATLLYSVSSTKDIVTIKSISREGTLEEPYLSLEELEKMIENSNESVEEEIAKLKKWYSEQKILWERELQNRSQEILKLKNDAKVVSRKFIELNDKNLILEKEIKEKSQEIVFLEKKISELKRNGETTSQEVINYIHELNRLKSEKENLITQYKDSSTEILRLKSERDELEKKREFLSKDLEKARKKLEINTQKVEEFNRALTTTNQFINACNDQIENAISQGNLLSSILKKTKKMPNVDQETLKKLIKNIQHIEKEKKNLEDMKVKSKKEVKELKTNMIDLEQQNKNLNDELYAMSNKLKEKEIEILYNQSIFEKLYEKIEHSSKYIYIAVPFISYYQLKSVESKILNIIMEHPNFEVKLLYGINEKKRKSDSDSEAIIKARAALDKLSLKFKNNMKKRETNTHIKLILFDDESFIMGSANVLSFCGDYENNPSLRSEIAFFSKDKELYAELRNKYFQWN